MSKVSEGKDVDSKVVTKTGKTVRMVTNKRIGFWRRLFFWVFMDMMVEGIFANSL
jgi:hypothetical protein